MGLKFKRFKAKLNWKTKETVPEVVCLRYQIHSEFDDPLVPAPSSNKTGANFGTNEVIKSKKLISKLPIQSLFENNITSTSTNKSDNNEINKTVNRNEAVKKDQVLKANNAVKANDTVEINETVITNANPLEPTSLPTAPPKGILKKSIYEEDVNEEIANNKDLKTSTNEDSNDELKKSALIFMTENHDCNDKIISQTENIVDTKRISTELYSTTQDEEKVELHEKDNILEQKSNREYTTSISSIDSDQDAKQVRWRNTVVEINPNLQLGVDMNEERDFIATEENSIDNFKVHFATHSFVKGGMQYEEETESENEVIDEPDNAFYGNRGAYSSQAASIFFAGEDPEPAPRVRNVQPDEDDDIVKEETKKS